MRNMDERIPTGYKGHTVIIEQRERVIITGIVEVDSFDDESVVLTTEQGYMALQGQNLHINSLNIDDGKLVVEGSITSLQYSDETTTQQTGFLRRLRRLD